MRRIDWTPSGDDEDFGSLAAAFIVIMFVFAAIFVWAAVLSAATP